MKEGQSTTPSDEGAASGKTDAGSNSGDDESQPGRSFLTRLFQRASGVPTAGSVTDERLRAAFGPVFRDTTPAELAMVANIVRLRDQRIDDVMIPRADIVAVAEDAPLADVIAGF